MKSYLRRKLFLTPAIFLVQFFLLERIMRLDPDPHHDGILYGAAVNVSHGGFPNRDAFAQYGPIVPTLQGLALHLFGPSLYNIRFQALCLFMISSMLIWYVARNYFADSVALLLSSCWAFTIPSVLPWPTIYSTLISIIAFLVIFDVKKKFLRNSSPSFYCGGLLIGIGVFARIHLIAIFILVFLTLIVIKEFRKHALAWLSGFSTSIVLASFIFWINDAFNSFIAQCITWPLIRYAGPELNKSYVVGLLWYPVVFFTFLGLLILFGSIAWKRSVHLASVAGASLIFVGLLCLSKIPRVGYLSLRNPRVLLIDFSKNMMNSLDYVVAFSILVLLFILFLKHKSMKIEYGISFAFAFGILTQLYPLYDVNHLWLISPLLIICVITIARDLLVRNRFITSGMPYVLIGLLVSLIVQLGFVLSTPRVEFKSTTLEGMYAPADFAKQLDDTLLHLEDHVAPGTASFDCLNGLYAGAGGNYLASTNQFVNWGPNASLSKKGELLFVCAIEQRQIVQYLNNGYRIVFKDPLTLFGDTKPRGFWNVLFSRDSLGK